MNDIFCFQPVALSDFCFSGAAAVQCAALRQQFRPCCPVDGTIHTAAAQQTAIGRIYDAVTVQFGNITLHHLNLIFYFFRKMCIRDSSFSVWIGSGKAPLDISGAHSISFRRQSSKSSDCTEE